MYRRRQCKLCGEPLMGMVCDESSLWEKEYCCYTCYLTDKILPPVETPCVAAGISKMVMRYRYDMIVNNETDPIYSEPFEEEEDSIMREDNER